MSSDEIILMKEIARQVFSEEYKYCQHPVWVTENYAYTKILRRERIGRKRLAKAIVMKEVE